MSTESLQSNDESSPARHSRSRSESPDYFSYDGQQSVPNSTNWWKNFVQVVDKSNSEFKISQETVPISPEKCFDWAISVGSQILANQGSDRRRRVLQYIVNSQNGINYILQTLEISLNTSILNNAVWLSYILRECANPRNGNYRTHAIRKLVESDGHLDTVIRMLINLQNMRITETNAQHKANINLTMINLIWVLSAMAQRGKIEFTIRKVKFLHGIIKTHFFGKHHTHYPLLKIFRVLARNHKVSSILGKDKVMKLILKIFNSFNNQPSAKFLILFDILSQLTKHKENCRRFLKSGLLISVMRAFSYWSLWKGNGLLKLSKSVMSIYAHLSTTRMGKKALVQSDALLNVKKLCELCPSERAFDEIIMKAVGVTYVAYRKDKVPVDDISSPVKFEVPRVNDIPIRYDTGSSSDEDDPDDADESDDANDLDDDESTVTINDDDNDDLLLDEGEEIASSEINNVSKIRSQGGLMKSGKGDAAEHVSDFMTTTQAQPPEMLLERLTSFGQYFKELDGEISENTKVFDELPSKTNSLVLAALNENFTADKSHASIPSTELKFFWLTDHPEYGDSKKYTDLRSTYASISNKVRSVVPFVKIAYPDFVMAYGAKRVEYINPVSDRATLRSKLLLHLGRASQEAYKSKVVYDLDFLLKIPESKPCCKSTKLSPSSKAICVCASCSTSDFQLGNDDEILCGNYDGSKELKMPTTLKFESRFESGNLRKAIQVGDKEYDLYLTSDVNSNRHNQWFYFQISNTLENCSYTFNIMNCIKGNSQFNYGMQPVIFSVGDALEGKGGWMRSGSNICYFKNGIRNVAGKKKRPYHTATFTLNFSRRGDIVYIAYHYPYTYSRLLTELTKMVKSADEKKEVLVRYDVICQTLNKNEVPLITITAPNCRNSPIELRELIFITSRVHPGESNSSWIMHGILHNLMFGKPYMENVLQRYVFKIIPMLNIEGVINGCHRCGLSNEDLNRRWRNPDPIIHPTIYNSKALIEFCCKVRNKVPVLYCDLHGHSRKKNVFFYGCSRARSWSASDRMLSEDPNVLQALPEAVARRNAAFALAACNFDVRRSRESTARVALWREFSIARSYTLETSYCGCDRGPYKGLSLGINHLIEVGENLSEAVEEFHNPTISSVPEYCITSHQSPITDPSKVNFYSLEEPRYRSGVMKLKRLHQPPRRKQIAGIVRQTTMNGTSQP